jgi:hypothetical protein
MQVLRQLLVRQVSHQIAVGPLKQQTCQTRNELMKRSRIQVHENAYKSLAHQIKKAPRDDRMVFQQFVQVQSRQDTNARGFLFLLEKGAVQTFRTSGVKKLIIADLKAPAIFGEMGCVGRCLYYCEAQAMLSFALKLNELTER